MTNPVHFLHIGKTGGTAAKAVLGPFAAPGRLVLYDHRTRLRDCPAGDPVFFVVRHPLDRFVSGFNSRLRQGRPRYHFPWSRREALVFRSFATASALGEALDSRNPARRLLARWAMGQIEHVREPLSWWLDGPAEVAARPRLMVGTLETLDADLERLLRSIGVDAPVSLPRDPVAAHATPDGMDCALSPRAARNLGRWYGEDIELYEACLRLREASLEAAPPRRRAGVTDKAAAAEPG